MIDDDVSLPTHVLVTAAQRAANAAGAGFYIRQRGDATRGTLLIVFHDFSGTYRLRRQVWTGAKRELVEVLQGDEATIEAAIKDEAAFDPDLWIVEIEDKQGRLFFALPFGMTSS